MTENYDIDYWFNQTKLHGNVDDYGKNYYAYKIFERAILPLTDLPDGYIVVMGTNRCESFELLCQHFGHDRCVGFDIANPTNHSRVIIKNCLLLDESDDMPIAFVHNDVGNFGLTPKAKMHAQIWAANNVVEGGYFLGRNNKNSIGEDIEKIMTEFGFDNTNLDAAQYASLKDQIPHYQLDSHMLSKRVSKIKHK